MGRGPWISNKVASFSGVTAAAAASARGEFVFSGVVEFEFECECEFDDEEDEDEEGGGVWNMCWALKDEGGDGMCEEGW